MGKIGQMGYNLSKEMPERYANTPRRDDWIRASHKSIVPLAPVACYRSFFVSAKNGKPCKKCGGNEWYNDGHCVTCTNERQRRYYRDNPEPKKANAKKWKQQNPDRKKELDSRWQKENKDRANESKQKWLRNNPGRAKEAARGWRKRNPDKKMAIEENRRARKNNTGGSYTGPEWKALVESYGGRCLCCGRTDVRLTVDHIVPISKGGSSDIGNIQCLCVQCNSSKGNKTIDYRPRTGLGRWIQKKLFE